MSYLTRLSCWLLWLLWGGATFLSHPLRATDAAADRLQRDTRAAFQLLRQTNAQNARLPRTADTRSFIVRKSQYPFASDQVLEELNQRLNFLFQQTGIQYYVLLHDRTYQIERTQVGEYQKLLQDLFQQSGLSSNTLVLAINVNQRLEQGPLINSLSGGPRQMPDRFVTRPLFGLCRGADFDATLFADLKRLLAQYFPVADKEVQFFWESYAKLSQDKLQGIVLGLYQALPKPYVAYSYYFRIDGKVLAIVNRAEKVKGHDLRELRLLYDQQAVERFSNAVATGQNGHNGMRPNPLLWESVLGNQVNYALKHPKIALIPHALREPYIEQFHLQYAQYHLYSKYRHYFALGFDPLAALPTYALVPDHSDPIELTLDAASLALIPTGLDFIPDALGGLYYTYQGKYLQASANFAAVAMVGISAVVVRRFVNGEEVLVQAGKLTAAQAEDLLQRLTAALGSEEVALKLLNYPRVEELLGNTTLLSRITATTRRAELLDDLVKQPQLLDEMLQQPTLLDAWEVLSSDNTFRKDIFDLRLIADFLDENPNKLQIIESSFKSRGTQLEKRNYISELYSQITKYINKFVPGSINKIKTRSILRWEVNTPRKRLIE